MLYPPKEPADPELEFGLAWAYATLPQPERDEQLRRPRESRFGFLQRLFHYAGFPEVLAAVQVDALRGWLATILGEIDFPATEARLGAECSDRVGHPPPGRYLLRDPPKEFFSLPVVSVIMGLWGCRRGAVLPQGDNDRNTLSEQTLRPVPGGVGANECTIGLLP